MMHGPATMLELCTVFPSAEHQIHFRVDLFKRAIIVEFMLDIRDPRNAPSNEGNTHLGRHNREERFRFQMPFSQLKVINQVDSANDKLDLLISLETPPKFFRKVDPHDTHEQYSKIWKDRDAWYRQTDVFYSRKSLKLPLTLRKPRPVIDLGKHPFQVKPVQILIEGSRTMDNIPFDVRQRPAS